MRPLVLSSIMLSAAFVVGCGVDNIQAPSPSARPPLLARGESRAERAFDFTTIDVPGAVVTSASGINARGDIVGNFTDATGTHGFLFRDGEFTTIDFPESVASDARGISPDGDIVGTYRLAGQTGQIHGYVRTKDGAFVAVNSAGHINTIAQRILADGTILGCRHDNTMGSMNGIMVSREGYSETEAFASMHNGATPDRRHIVGLYTNMEAGNRGEGYRIDDGVFTALLVPNSTLTAAWDINPAGEIVGVYRLSGVRHGFVLRDEGYVPIDYPGATVTETRAFGINARGDVVGNYIAAGKTHGYLASR